jgi:hypothetical protein
MADQNTELKSLLLAPGKRPVVVDDCARLIDEEVDSKGGLSGMAIKMTYKVVKALKPTMIRESVDALLDEFVEKLEPHYAKYREGGAGSLESYCGKNAASLADALLGITDQRARRSKNGTLKGAYEKLRPEGKKHVEAAMPRVARMLTRHGA